MYRYETHFHTEEVSPCGKVKAEEGIRLYAEYGYDGVIVTDHFYNWKKDVYPRWKDYIDFFLQGYRAAKEAGEKYGIRVFLGAEIRFDEDPNDYVAFGFDEDYLYETENLMGMTLEKYNESVQDKSILIFQAHPYRKNCEVRPKELLHGIEVFNGNARHNSSNEQAKKYAIDNRLLQLSGSDFHQIMDLARGGIVTKTPCEDVHRLVEIIKALNYELIEF
ncbi:MAG: PHP domain-containing protein [Clostridia bacterium]|jgi:predicted metal-dependent phosphoesterase TrpH